jgi:hypothetical protein
MIAQVGVEALAGAFEIVDVEAGRAARTGDGRQRAADPLAPRYRRVGRGEIDARWGRGFSGLRWSWSLAAFLLG